MSRLRYAFWLAAALWSAWLLSLWLGQGYLDLAGQPIGTDFLQFYAAGRTLLMGESARLYDFAFQAEVERAIIGPGLTSYHAFITPPLLAWLFVPLAALPYPLSFALWSLAGLAALGMSVWMLAPQGFSWRRLGWTLTFFPVFASISFGQNSLLSLALLSLTYFLWLREKKFAAGLVLSLLLYKPQLAVGIAGLWLWNWRRDYRALLGLGLGAGLGAALSWLTLTEASLAYLRFAREVLPNLPAWQDFPIWHLHTLRGFWRLLLPMPLADELWLMGILLGLGVWGATLRRVHDPARRFAAAVLLTLWVTPHAMIYDWSLLLIPALLVWEACPLSRSALLPAYTALWLASLLSGPLTYLQWQTWHRAVQLSLPTFVWAVLKGGRAAFTADEPATSVGHTTSSRPHPSQ